MVLEFWDPCEFWVSWYLCCAMLCCAVGKKWVVEVGVSGCRDDGGSELCGL